MASSVFSAENIQDSGIAPALRSRLQRVLDNGFFVRLRDEPVSLEGYRLFVREKYSAVAYFVALLENAERRIAPHSAELAEAVRTNRLDEQGHFSGQVRDAYRHETWRRRSLARLGIPADLLTGFRLEGSKQHETAMRALALSEDPFELIGALLFLELFVVCEMKDLIAAFERDLPDEFPPGGYCYDRFPHNPHEYWYGHALHDVWHFRAIEEPLIGLLSGDACRARRRAIQTGIERVAEAKEAFYSAALFEAMATATSPSASVPLAVCQ